MESHLKKALGASILGLSMTILPLSLPALAQNSNTDTGSNSAASDTRTTTSNDRGFDWGWLGLLGLFGLVGLRGKGRTEETPRYRDPNAVGSTNYRE